MLRNRVDAARIRTDTRDWGRERRERTRHLIELGGLVELTDNRATLLGALLDLADRLQADERQDVGQFELLARWRRRGLRILNADKPAVAE